ncbi:MAG TPA: sarcosine oxidase subunit gamma family protein [Steroidobacteraceae bacterium]|nr:sarcosine oxidase subunit gamma family protein [Steroidobacteraceae bacterium]
MSKALKRFVAQPALPEGEQVLSTWLQLRVQPPRASVRLQVASQSVSAATAIAIRDVMLPQQPNSWAGTDPVICRIAPDAWLLQSRRDSASDLIAATRSKSEALFCAVTDLSDALVTLELEGPDSYALLARGCGLDLSPAAFGARACARTRLAQCAVLVRHAAPARIELIVDRSLAQYVHGWLLDAAMGLSGEAP